MSHGPKVHNAVHSVLTETTGWNPEWVLPEKKRGDGQLN